MAERGELSRRRAHVGLQSSAGDADPLPADEPLMVLAISTDATVIQKIGSEVSRADLVLEGPGATHLHASVACADAVLIDITHGVDGSLEVMRRAKARKPALAVVAIADLTMTAARAVLTCGHAGVDAVAFIGRDHLGAVIDRAIDSCRRSHAFESAGKAIAEARVPDPANSLLRCALMVACRGGQVKSLCAALGLSRKTLDRRFAVAGLDSPGATLDWLRVVLAAQLLRDGRGSQEITTILGLGCIRTLRALVRRCTGAGLEDLHSQSAPALLRGFADRIMPQSAATVEGASQ
jgi:AraC-like DNA-binding protein